ncbi:MAG TPA: hypothetical protein VLH84_05115 [Patescibacteria group bacterium]|nr:hypothetical protein [Patescibacteria group bacterium]
MGVGRAKALNGGARQQRERLWREVLQGSQDVVRDERLARAAGAAVLGLRARTQPTASAATEARLRAEADKYVTELLDGVVWGVSSVPPIPDEPYADPFYTAPYWEDKFPVAHQRYPFIDSPPGLSAS